MNYVKRSLPVRNNYLFLLTILISLSLGPILALLLPAVVKVIMLIIVVLPGMDGSIASLSEPRSPTNEKPVADYGISLHAADLLHQVHLMSNPIHLKQVPITLPIKIF